MADSLDPAHAAPAIRLKDSDRPDLLIFEIHAELHSDDMRWMGERVSERFEAQGRIDILILFQRFDGATAGALVEPKALKVEAASLLHVRRYGVVGAPGWADAAITVGGWMSPIDSRTFDQGEETQALAWINRP